MIHGRDHSGTAHASSGCVSPSRRKENGSTSLAHVDRAGNLVQDRRREVRQWWPLVSDTEHLVEGSDTEHLVDGTHNEWVLVSLGLAQEKLLRRTRSLDGCGMR